MKPDAASKPLVAIACGGTGGHLFPGLAVAEQLRMLNCEVTLLISPKEVDQHAVQSALGMEVATLPAVGLMRHGFPAFLSGCWKSYRLCRSLFRNRPPQAVLAMGGFTSAPPVLAGKACGAATFVHESNTIPGKANRWLAHFVDQAFVGFPSAAGRLHHTNVLCTGTPVRPQFQAAAPAACRQALGASPERPLLLVMGGSQGASGINDLMLGALAPLRSAAPDLQFIHLTGAKDLARVQAAYDAHKARAIVRPFLTEIEWALGAASVAVSRAGASSLAELAAMRLPAVLIPYPVAADNHQFHNARAFVETGAALLLEQSGASGAQLASLILSLVQQPGVHAAMAQALERWHQAHAAQLIAERILARLEARRGTNWKRPALAAGSAASQQPSTPPRWFISLQTKPARCLTQPGPTPRFTWSVPAVAA